MSKPVVLVPTKSRPQNVEPVVEAWWRTGAFNVWDLYFVVDADDASYGEYMNVIRYHTGANVVVLPEWMPLVPKLNRVAVEFAQDRPLVAFMGDDHIPRSEMWYSHVYSEHTVRHAGIVYGRDGLQDQKLSTWWSMDSRIINALGRMVPAEVQHLFCDNAVMELGRAAGVLRYLDNVLVEHMHPIAGKAKIDAQYERVNRTEQYARDAAGFQAYVQHGLARDATILRDIWG